MSIGIWGPQTFRVSHKLFTILAVFAHTVLTVIRPSPPFISQALLAEPSLYSHLTAAPVSYSPQPLADPFYTVGAT